MQIRCGFYQFHAVGLGNAKGWWSVRTLYSLCWGFLACVLWLLLLFGIFLAWTFQLLLSLEPSQQLSKILFNILPRCGFEINNILPHIMIALNFILNLFPFTFITCLILQTVRMFQITNGPVEVDLGVHLLHLLIILVLIGHTADGSAR